jgi:hypothetical protein
MEFSFRYPPHQSELERGRRDFVPALTVIVSTSKTCGVLELFDLAGLWAAGMNRGGRGVRPYMAGLDIQVLHVERVFFDEFAAGFDVFAHQRGEDGFALSDVFKPH